MNERLKRVFDEITPLSSGMELYESTVSKAVGKAENMEKGTENKRLRLSKPIVVLIAVVAALAIGTISVGAYYNWDFESFLASWGGEDNAENLDKMSSKVTVENVRNTYENLDISISGALKDDDLNMIFVNIERTDGGVFDNSEYNVTCPDGDTLVVHEYSMYASPTFEKLSMWHTKEWDEEHGYYTNFSVSPHLFIIKDDDPIDNKMTAVISWLDNKSAEGSTLVLKLDNMKMPRYRSITREEVESGIHTLPYEISEAFEGQYYARITLEKIDTYKRTAYTDRKASFKSVRSVLTKGNWEDLDGQEDFDKYVVEEDAYVDYDIDYVSVSSMKLSFDLRYRYTEADNWTDNYKPMDWYPYVWYVEEELYVNMKDGSSFKAPIRYDDQTFWSERASSSPVAHYDSKTHDSGSICYHKEYMLPYPINVDDVKSVNLCGTEVYFE